MIKYYLIISLIAALVPTAAQGISTPMSAERGMFSFISSSNENTLTITGNGNSAEMQLKATKENGGTNKVSDFRLTADNVLFIEQNGKVTITDDVAFTRALVTDSKDNEKRIDITSNGVIDFAGYAQGVYTLDVVVDDRRAFEAIIVIGDQEEEVVNKEVTRVTNKQITEIWIEIIFEIDCGTGYHLDEYGFCVPDEPSVCYFDPSDPACDPVDGKCPEGFGFNDDDRCIPQGDCPDGYVRADDDETGTCYDPDDLVECDDGSIRLPGDTCPPVECEPGYGFVNGRCQFCEYYDVNGECRPMPQVDTLITPTLTPAPTPTPNPQTPTPPIDQLLTTPSPTPNPLARGLQPTVECDKPGYEIRDGQCLPIEQPEIDSMTPLPPTPTEELDDVPEESIEDTEDTDTETEEDVEEEVEEDTEEEDSAQTDEPEQDSGNGDDDNASGN
jgi:hypothetical protein